MTVYIREHVDLDRTDEQMMNFHYFSHHDKTFLYG